MGTLKNFLSLAAQGPGWLVINMLKFGLDIFTNLDDNIQKEMLQKLVRFMEYQSKVESIKQKKVYFFVCQNEIEMCLSYGSCTV